MSRKASKIVAAATLAVEVACASAPRNKVLDTYPAGVVGRTSVFYYDVQGRTFAEVRADMHRLGPKLADGSFVGETRSPMRWTWRTQSTGPSTCEIRDVTVSVNAQITLPRWTPPPDTEPGLAAEWTRFIAALETHEAGHKDISAKAGHDIQERLRGLSGLCSQVSTRANDLTREIVEKSEAEQKAYDAATRHGITQGTSFGPRRPSGVGGTGALDPTAPLTLLAPPRPGSAVGFVPIELERVWGAIPAVYRSVDLRINAIDSAAFAVGDSFTVHGKLDAYPLNTLIDCGTATAGRSADSVDVAMFVTTRLQVAQPPMIAVTNTVQAVERPAGGPPIACRSLGVIEQTLIAVLRRQLGP